MSDSRLEKMRQFVASYPDFDVLGSLSIDYTDRVPANAGLFPSGMVEISRTSDILGRATVENQLNFALYAVLEKSAGEDVGATYNAEWLAEFQEWVQEQSVTHQAPAFGDRPNTESIRAENGAIYAADSEGTAMYVVQINVRFTKVY